MKNIVGMTAHSLFPLETRGIKFIFLYYSKKLIDDKSARELILNLVAYLFILKAFSREGISSWHFDLYSHRLTLNVTAWL